MRMVAYIRVYGREHMREWSPSITKIYGSKIKKRQGLLQALYHPFYWGCKVLTSPFSCINFAEETKKFTYAKTDDILSCSVSNAEQTLCSAS